MTSRIGSVFSGLLALFCSALFSACLPTQTILVRFEDLKSDFFALESALQSGEWAKFDWKSMTITISSARPPSSTRLPMTMGAFESPRDKSGRDRDRSTLLAAGDKSAAIAEQPEIDLRSLAMTDTIVQLMQRRQARFSKVMDMKGTGVVGESNGGLLNPPNGKPMDSLSTDDRAVADAENSDREMLFDEVLRQKGLPADKRYQVAQKFAEVQHAMASKGFWVQMKDGKWSQI